MNIWLAAKTSAQAFLNECFIASAFENAMHMRGADPEGIFKELGLEPPYIYAGHTPRE